MPVTKDQYVCLNGDYLAKVNNHFFIRNRAFLYGDGFFETIFTSGARIPFFEKHCDRINRAIRQYKLIPPPGFSAGKLREDIEGLIHRNKSYTASRVRITFYRNDGGLYTPQDNRFSYFINSERLPDDTFQLNKQGFRVDVFETLKKNIDPFAAFKNINARLYVQAGLYKQENKLDECIILNAGNEVCESISSNVFLAHGNNVFTPALSGGCVDGVMRKTVMELLQQGGYKVQEGIIRLEDIPEAEEVFLTNAVAGVHWIGAFRTKRYYNFIAKYLVKALNELIG